MCDRVSILYVLLANHIRTMVTSGPGLLPRTMSGSRNLPQLESVVMFVAHIATKDHTDARDLGCNLWPAMRVSWVMMLPEPC